MKKYIPLQCFNKQLIVLQILKSKENVAIAAISFASCGNKNTTVASTNDSDTTAVNDSADTTAQDTTAHDTTVMK